MRRTKEDAQLTRERLLDAAELLFADRGVSGTSLQDIAQQAGLTRGALYWHFKDKGELFNAMMRRTTLPLEEALQRATDRSSLHPLQDIRKNLLYTMSRVVNDPQMRRVFDIATQKIEYINEMTAAKERHLQALGNKRRFIEGAIRRARALGQVGPNVTPKTTGLGLMALMSGLLNIWMLDPDQFNLQAVAAKSIDAFLAGLTREAPSPDID